MDLEDIRKQVLNEDLSADLSYLIDKYKDYEIEFRLIKDITENTVKVLLTAHYKIYKPSSYRTLENCVYCGINENTIIKRIQESLTDMIRRMDKEISRYKPSG